jgi:hypothetical protein
MTPRARGPLSGALLADTEGRYRAEFGAADGRLPATFELLTLTGHAPAR